MSRRIYIYFALALFAGFLPIYAQADFDRTLQFGMRNSAEVRALQEFLKGQQVYTGPVTGNFLTLTREGVVAFQKKEGLPAVGIFGPQTRARANTYLSARSAAFRANLETQISALRDQVRILQDRLAEAERREIAPAVIEPRSLVALNCFYVYQPTGRMMNVGKGSGVIIRSDGTILTARHLIDLSYSHKLDPQSVTQQVAENSTFDHCEVGQVPAGATLPSASEIVARNPVTEVSSFPYEARLIYLPTSASLGVSELEAEHLDFALIRITDRNVVFPAAQLLQGRLEKGDEVLSYGYPAGSDDRSFRLTGAVGRVKALQVGDLRYRELPLVVNTELIAQQGRSGSPLFYRGYIAGIVTAHAAGDPQDSFSVSIEAIRPLLQDILGGF